MPLLVTVLDEFPSGNVAQQTPSGWHSCCRLPIFTLWYTGAVHSHCWCL